ncbi:MAG: hypothetical protein V3W22_08075, partial [Thermoplasmata archaeon]
MPKTLKGGKLRSMKGQPVSLANKTDEELFDLTQDWRILRGEAESSGRGMGHVIKRQTSSEKAAMKELQKRGLIPKEGPGSDPMPTKSYRGGPGGGGEVIDLSREPEKRLPEATTESGLGRPPSDHPASRGGGRPDPVSMSPGGESSVDPSAAPPASLDVASRGEATYRGKIVGDMQSPIFGTRVKPSRRDPYGHRRHGQGGIYTPPEVRIKQTGGPEDPNTFALAQNEAKWYSMHWNNRLHPQQRAQMKQKLTSERQEILIRKKTEDTEAENKDLAMTQQFQKAFMLIAKQIDKSTGQQVSAEKASEIVMRMMPDWFRKRLKADSVKEWAKGMGDVTGIDINEQRRRKESGDRAAAQKKRDDERTANSNRDFEFRKGQVEKE